MGRFIGGSKDLNSARAPFSLGKTRTPNQFLIRTNQRFILRPICSSQPSSPSLSLLAPATWPVNSRSTSTPTHLVRITSRPSPGLTAARTEPHGTTTTTSVVTSWWELRRGGWSLTLRTNLPNARGKTRTVVQAHRAAPTTVNRPTSAICSTRMWERCGQDSQCAMSIASTQITSESSTSRRSARNKTPPARYIFHECDVSVSTQSIKGGFLIGSSRPLFLSENGRGHDQILATPSHVNSQP